MSLRDSKLKDREAREMFYRKVIESLELEESRSEEHTSELQLRIDIAYAVFCLKKEPVKNS